MEITLLGQGTWAVASARARLRPARRSRSSIETRAKRKSSPRSSRGSATAVEPGAPLAKRKVSELASDAGLRPIDVGPLRRAQQLEQLGFLHISLQQPHELGFGSLEGLRLPFSTRGR